MSIPKSIGRYEILDELGQGAMGSVFRARDPAIDRIVAVKTILATALASGQDEEARQRFYREARAAGALAHPGIVPIFDIGEHDGVPFLVMEFVDGQTLGQAMKRGERASLDRVCEIGQKIAEALGYAHRNGVIHRDIKPTNILMTSRQTYGEERPRITDFGVAKLAAGELTLTGQFLGTPAFMPPEQFTGEPIDGRTDLFSLGVILYWMATGEQPFPGETMTAVSYKIVHTEPVPPAKLNPAIPPQLDAVILKSLAKSPANRYQTGEELAEVLAKLRTQVGPAVLHAAVPVATIPSGQSQETLDATKAPAQMKIPSASGAPVTLEKSPSAPINAPKKRALLVLAAIGLVAVAAAATGGYFFMHRKQAPPSQALPAPTDAGSQPSTDVSPAGADATTSPGSNEAAVGGATVPVSPGSSTSPGGGSAFDPPATVGTAKKPSPLNPSNSATSPTSIPGGSTATPGAGSVVSATAPATGAPHQSASVAFDPTTLDPKKNTHLKFDFSHFPPNAAVAVEMDGKLFFRGSATAKASYENLYAPPGMHEVRVRVSGAGVQKTSNIVSAEFVPKKHMTLKVEIRSQAKGSHLNAGRLESGAQVIATLKTGLFSF